MSCAQRCSAERFLFHLSFKKYKGLQLLKTEKSFICFVHQKINVFLSHRSYLPLLQESHAGCNPSGWKPLGPTLNGIEPSPQLPFVHTTLGAGTELSPGLQRQRSSPTYFLTEFSQPWAINCQFQPRGTLTSSYPWALLLSWARGCPHAACFTDRGPAGHPTPIRNRKAVGRGSIFRSTVRQSRRLCRELEASLGWFPPKQSIHSVWARASKDARLCMYSHVISSKTFMERILYAYCGRPVKFEFQINSLV